MLGPGRAGSGFIRGEWVAADRLLSGPAAFELPPRAAWVGVEPAGAGTRWRAVATSDAGGGCDGAVCRARTVIDTVVAVLSDNAA